MIDETWAKGFRMYLRSIIAIFVAWFVTSTATAEPNDVLFAGSSTISGWNLMDSFPELNTVNIGISGTTYAHIRGQIDSKIVPNGASRIVFYSGDNDLYSGQSPEQVFDMFRQVSESIHEKLPESRIFVISIKPSPDRRLMIPEVKRTNALIQEYSASREFVIFVDLYSHMVDNDGEPLSNLFITDGLHLNDRGYQLWTSD
jgi:lysophospholipase L1-like esterase